MKKNVEEMKKNVGFLFIVLVGWVGYQDSTLLYKQGNTIYLISGLFQIGLSIAYLYIHISLEKLLVKFSRIIIAVILMGMAFLVVVFLICLPDSWRATEIVRLVSGLLLHLYLLYLLINIRRLSLEERSKRGNNQ